MTGSFIILCLIVCFGRIIDVSLGTTRTVFTVRGKPYIAAIIGFIEAALWFLIVREALIYKAIGFETYVIALAYALGYACGTYLGGMVTSKLITSKINVQIIATNKNDELTSALSEAGYGATILVATGANKKEERYMEDGRLKMVVKKSGSPCG